MILRRLFSLSSFAIAWLCAGCMPKTPVSAPVPMTVPSAPPPETRKSDTRLHLEGSWVSRGANGNQGQLTFAPDGTLTFKGKLEFYNPAHWDLDEGSRELRLTFPQADYERLQVFQMAVGDGIKAFDPAKRQITYDFDAETWTLPVAGWTYSKTDNAASPARTELEDNQ